MNDNWERNSSNLFSESLCVGVRQDDGLDLAFRARLVQVPPFREHAGWRLFQKCSNSFFSIWIVQTEAVQTHFILIVFQVLKDILVCKICSKFCLSNLIWTRWKFYKSAFVYFGSLVGRKWMFNHPWETWSKRIILQRFFKC